MRPPRPPVPHSKPSATPRRRVRVRSRRRRRSGRTETLSSGSGSRPSSGLDPDTKPYPPVGGCHRSTSLPTRRSPLGCSASTRALCWAAIRPDRRSRAMGRCWAPCLNRWSPSRCASTPRRPRPSASLICVLGLGSMEVDLIVERGDGRVLAVEVKLGRDVRDDDVRHLRWLAERIGRGCPKPPSSRAASMPTAVLMGSGWVSPSPLGLWGARRRVGSCWGVRP